MNISIADNVFSYLSRIVSSHNLADLRALHLSFQQWRQTLLPARLQHLHCPAPIETAQVGSDQLHSTSAEALHIDNHNSNLITSIMCHNLINCSITSVCLSFISRVDICTTMRITLRT